MFSPWCFKCGHKLAARRSIPGFGPVYQGSQAVDLGVHPPEVSGVGVQAADRGAADPGALGLCDQAGEPLICMHSDSRLCASGAAGLLI